MSVCVRCSTSKDHSDFYQNDRTCKECRRALVRDNRARKIDYYRDYDRKRGGRPDRAEARNEYQQTDAGRLAAGKAKRRYIERNPLRRAAHIAVRNAVRDGRLWKAPCCMAPDCFNQGTLHGHHTHYDSKLSVVWLCVSCHAEVHKQFNEFVE